jgi:cell division protein FtsX
MSVLELRSISKVFGATVGGILIALGVLAAFLASLAWAHSSLTQTFGNVPWSDIGLLVIGMPLVGAAAGWLLGGRAPSAVSRQPLE